MESGGSGLKMPEGKIDGNWFAPCGMNCLVCYKHCCHKKPCAGCLNCDEGKPEHCRKCKIKSCTAEKGVRLCYQCGVFPCKLIKNLEKSYRTRYRVSLVRNSEFVRERGLNAFMEGQREAYTCPVCGGIISLHDARCGECGAKRE